MYSVKKGIGDRGYRGDGTRALSCEYKIDQAGF